MTPLYVLSILISYTCFSLWMSHVIGYSSHHHVISVRNRNGLTQGHTRVGGGSEDERHNCSISVKTRTSRSMGPSASPPGFLRSTFPLLPWNRLPNTLTYIRCVAVPLFLVIFLHPQLPQKNIYLATIFGLASFTDYLDGFLARRWDVTSPFGAFLDPVADKLLVSTSLVLLSGHYGSIVSIPSAIILAREIAVSALREWMAQQSLRDSVKVSWQGKVKTASTMISISLLLLSLPIAPVSPHSATITSISGALWKYGIFWLYLSTIMTITSGWTYFKAAFLL